MNNNENSAYTHYIDGVIVVGTGMAGGNRHWAPDTYVRVTNDDGG